MLSLFSSARQKLESAIEQGDLERFERQLEKLEAQQIDVQLLALTISQQQPKMLSQLAAKAPSLELLTEQGEPLLLLALQQANSLPLLSALLTAGADIAFADNHAEQSMLFSCLELCPQEQQLLHISRLSQFGASLEQTNHQGLNLLQIALLEARHDWIQMFCKSGLTVEQRPEGCLEESWTLAERCMADYRIRQSFHQR